jgi:hypothetical protein
MSEIVFKEINAFLRVGDDGSVQSKAVNSDKWRTLSTQLKNGKPTVRIEADSRRARRHVAALVLESFIGPRPDGMKPIHKNGRLSDCRAENLFWGERQRQSIFDDEVEADLEMLGENGIDEILRYFWGAGVQKKSIAEAMETEYRTIQYVIDTYTDQGRIKKCLA